jgi:hypothetical protein
MVADMETSAALGSAKQDRAEYGDMPVRRSVANDHALGARKFNLPGFFCLGLETSRMTGLERWSRRVVWDGGMFAVRSADRWDSGPYHSGR